MDFREVVRKNVFRTKWVDTPSSVPPFCQADVLLTTSLSYKGGIPEDPGVGLLEQTDPDPGRHLGNPVTRRFVHLLTWYWLFSKQNGSKMLDSIAVLLLHIRVAYHILQAFYHPHIGNHYNDFRRILHGSHGLSGRRAHKTKWKGFSWIWLAEMMRTTASDGRIRGLLSVSSYYNSFFASRILTISFVHTYTKVWNLSSKRLKCFHQSHLKKYLDYRKVSKKITWLIHLLRPIPWNGKRMFRYDIKDFRFDN